MHLIDICTLIILINFSRIICDGLLRKDYYESFSNLRQCLIFSHYFPSGPSFLFVKVEYNLSSFLFGYESKNFSFYNCFRKINIKCNNSVFITTIEKDFRKLHLTIYIKLFENEPPMANIEYTLYNGIPIINYEFFDIYQHFSVKIKIYDNIKKYFLPSICILKEMESYFNSISKKSGDLCLLTWDNDAVVFKPKYENFKPNSYITHFKTEFIKNGELFLRWTHVAFNCNKTSNYYTKPIVLIIDQQKTDITYMASGLKFSNGVIIKEEYKFSIYNTPYIYINHMEYVPETYKKVFIIKNKLALIRCQDGTKRMKFLSNDNITYYILEFKKVNINPYLEHYICINHSPDDLC